MKKIIMPFFGETTNEEIAITGWMKQVGEYVEIGEPLFEIEGEKVVLQVEAVEKGYLKEIIKKIGDKAKPGEVVCLLME